MISNVGFKSDQKALPIVKQENAVQRFNDHADNA
jgi:hypothetical protein